MTNTISLEMVNGCQSEGTAIFFWNGYSFTTNVAKLKGEMIAHIENAKAFLKENAGIAYQVIFEENNPAAYSYKVA